PSFCAVGSIFISMGEAIGARLLRLTAFFAPACRHAGCQCEVTRMRRLRSRPPSQVVLANPNEFVAALGRQRRSPSGPDASRVDISVRGDRSDSDARDAP